MPETQSAMWFTGLRITVYLYLFCKKFFCWQHTAALVEPSGKFTSYFNYIKVFWSNLITSAV